MTTVVNNPGGPQTERVVVEKSDTGGWAVAVVILIAIIAIGGFAWMYYHPAAATPAPADTSGGANINVTIPAGDNSGGASGGTTNPPPANPAQ